MEDYLMSTEQIELCVSWRDKEVFKNHTPHSIHASFAKETDNGLDKWGIPPIGSQLSFDIIQKRIDPQSSSRGFKRNMLVLTLCAQIIRAVDWVSISLCFLCDREVSR